MHTIRDTSLGYVETQPPPARDRDANAALRHCAIISAIALIALALSLLLPSAQAPAPDPLRPQSQLATQRINPAEHAESVQASQAASGLEADAGMAKVTAP